VTLIKLAKDEKLVGLERVQEPSGEDIEAELDEEGNPIVVSETDQSVAGEEPAAEGDEPAEEDRDA